jgi:hypothetical protein
MNVEIGIEAAQFPEKEYISGIFLARQQAHLTSQQLTQTVPTSSRCATLWTRPRVSDQMLAHSPYLTHTIQDYLDVKSILR